MYPKKLDESFDLAINAEKISAWLADLPPGLYYTKDMFDAYMATHGMHGGRHWRLFADNLRGHGLLLSSYKGCTIARKLKTDGTI